MDFLTTVQLATPSKELFTVPPSQDPITIPSPRISSALYYGALDVRVPLTIATVYATIVILVNRYNKSNGNKPWGISKTKAFFWFVIAHNVFLAIYSGWTFLGMFTTLQRTISSFSCSSGGFASTIDSLCKIHGTSGLGNGAFYDPEASAWTSHNPAALLLTNHGTPSAAQSGRLWNEGLSYFGFWFYLSKFYEVLDTFIILAKGKRSQTLQTYHHAGAMMCMWAGIRYMSPPIWMFVFVNSFIHTVMYTYFTVTAFSIKVPLIIKSSLTTLQIIQFLVGSSYAALHSFVTYNVPVQIPYVETVVKTAAPSMTTTATTVAAFASAVGFGDIVKKYLFRAAGGEGLAENVGSDRTGEKIISTKFRTEYQTVPCVTTSGETFAIWLNVLYLTPLTYLFVRFFIKSYIFPQKKTYKLKKALVEGEKVAMNGNGKANGHTNGHA